MKLRLSIDYADGTSFADTFADAAKLRELAGLLNDIAFEHDPKATHRPTSAAQVERIDLSWEA